MIHVEQLLTPEMVALIAFVAAVTEGVKRSRVFERQDITTGRRVRRRWWAHVMHTLPYIAGVGGALAGFLGDVPRWQDQIEAGAIAAWLATGAYDFVRATIKAKQ